MLRLLIVTSGLFVSSCADVDFSFSQTCFSKGGDLELSAKYTGSGTVTAVQWYYSGQVGGNLIVLASTCDILGAPDPGYPDKSRMNFTCAATNTFTLTLKGLLEDELQKSWGATFSLSSGSSPTTVQEPIQICTGCQEDCKIRVIVSIVFCILGIIALVVAIIFIVKRVLNNPVWLVVDVIGLVSDIISLGLTASFLTDEKCMKDCEDWKPSAIAFVVIPSIVAVVAIAVLIKICCNKCCGNGN